MPDRWNRPTMQDGLNLLGGIRAMQNIDETNRNQKHDSQVNDYLTRISKGEAIDSKEKGYSYRAHLDAEATQTKKLFNDETFRQQKLQTEAAQRQQNQGDIDKRIATADFYKKQGNERMAMETIFPIYNFFPDGHKYEGMKPGSGGGRLLMKNQEGNQYEMDAPTYDQAMNVAVKFSKNYSAMDEQAKDKELTRNLQLLDNRGIHKTKDDKEAVYTEFVKGGRVLQTWADPETGKTLKGFDKETGEIIGPSKDNDFRSPEYYKDQDSLENNKATRKKMKAEAGKKGQDVDAGKRKKYKEDLGLMLALFAGQKAESSDEFMGDEGPTEKGKTKLGEAQSLVTKYKNKEELTDDEKKQIKHALRVTEMYNKISDDVSSDYLKTEKGDNWRKYQ